MSKNLRQNRYFLHFLQEAKSLPQKKALLQSVTTEQLKVLTEIIYNLLHSDFPLSKKQLESLRKHKKVLRFLGNKSNSNQRKKHLLKKSVTVIDLVLKIVSPLLNSL